MHKMIQKTEKKGRNPEKIRQDAIRTRRFLIGIFGASVVTVLLWLIAMNTNYWVSLVPPTEGFKETKSGMILQRQYGGIWRLCREEVRNETGVYVQHDYCLGIIFSPDTDSGATQVFQGILDFRRSIVAIAIITTIISLFAVASVWYTINHPRYIFKRLAGCLLLGCAGLILVTNELFQRLVGYEKEHLAANFYPSEASHQFGFSFGLSWTCFILFIVLGIFIFLLSRKRKNENEDDIPVIIGRI